MAQVPRRAGADAVRNSGCEARDAAPGRPGRLPRRVKWGWVSRLYHHKSTLICKLVSPTFPSRPPPCSLCTHARLAGREAVMHELAADRATSRMQSSNNPFTDVFSVRELALRESRRQDQVNKCTAVSTIAYTLKHQSQPALTRREKSDAPRNQNPTPFATPSFS